MWKWKFILKLPKSFKGFIRGGSLIKPMPLGCTAICRPMTGLVSLSKFSTAQLRPHPYWASNVIFLFTWARRVSIRTFMVPTSPHILDVTKTCVVAITDAPIDRFIFPLLSLLLNLPQQKSIVEGWGFFWQAFGSMKFGQSLIVHIFGVTISIIYFVGLTITNASISFKATASGDVSIIMQSCFSIFSISSNSKWGSWKWKFELNFQFSMEMVMLLNSRIGILVTQTMF